MRLFFAIALSESARNAAVAVAEGVQQQLARQGAARAIKWVERENLHVTVRFIGEVEEGRVAPLIDAMRAPIVVPTYRIVLGHGGCFPRSGPPRVAWLGASEGIDETRRVYTALDARLAPLGFEQEGREYTPHVTLGRVREIDRAGTRVLREALDTTPAVLAAMDARTITLYRSHLSPKGPRYEMQLEIPLS
jgi:2'-5' RNA ligase